MYNAETTITRALDSIPEREDIEILIIDDCSTDNSLDVARNYQKNSDKNICILTNDENNGVGYTVNRIIDNCYGKYLILLGSDDYFYEDLDKFINKYLGETDIVYFNLEDNLGHLYCVNEETKHYYCGSVKAIKRDFIGDTRCPNIRCGEDYYFYEELIQKKPTEIFTGMRVKHYNFPRKDSLIWKATHES